jgi:hypothetical protein
MLSQIGVDVGSDKIGLMRHDKVTNNQ